MSPQAHSPEWRTRSPISKAAAKTSVWIERVADGGFEPVTLVPIGFGECAVSCMNALAGVEDPEAYIAKLKKDAEDAALLLQGLDERTMVAVPEAAVKAAREALERTLWALVEGSGWPEEDPIVIAARAALAALGGKP